MKIILNNTLLIQYCIIIFFCFSTANINYSYSQNHEWSFDCGPVNKTPSLTTDKFGIIYLCASINATPSFPLTIGSVTLTQPADLIKFNNQGTLIQALDMNFGQNNIMAPAAGGGRIIATSTNASQQTSLYFAGAISPSIPYLQASLAKFDENGNFIWQRTATGTQILSEGKAIAVDRDGNIYMTGYFDKPSITFGNTPVFHSPNLMSYEYFIVKYDSSGNLLWAQNAGPLDCNITYAGISVDSYSSVYVLINSEDPFFVFANDTLSNYNTSPGHPFILKFDSNGNRIWGRSLEESLITDIAVDSLDNIIVAGQYGPLINIPSLTGSGVMIIKYDINGNLLWANGGKVNYGLCNSVTVDASGNSHVAGSFTDTHIYFNNLPYANFDTFSVSRGGNVSDNYYAKFDVNGNFLYAYVFGGTTGGGQKVYSMANDVLGNTYITGEYKSPFIIIGNDTLRDVSGNRKLFLTKVSSQATSIDFGIEKEDLVIFPNPVSDKLYFSTTSEKNYKIKITDMQGRLISNQDGNQNSEMNVSNLQNGIYLVNVIFDSKIITSKIIKLE